MYILFCFFSYSKLYVRFFSGVELYDKKMMLDFSMSEVNIFDLRNEKKLY